MQNVDQLHAHDCHQNAKRERERASRAAKTADEKEWRLRQHRERDRVRRAAQSIEKGEA